MIGAESRQFAGLAISAESLDEVAEKLVKSRWGQTAPGDVHLLNAFSISLTAGNEDYYSCLKSAVANLPDGKPLSILTRFSKKPLQQVAGPDLFEAVLHRGIESGLRHFFLGSTEETLKLLTNAVEMRFPGVVVAGTMSPPFRGMSEAEYLKQDELIRQSSPDIVWVGLGTPKQDFEAQRLASEGFLAVAVGAAFDFTAGTVRRSPAWISQIGMEWLFRLSTEPKRLWKRYLIGNWVFLYTIVVRRGK